MKITTTKTNKRSFSADYQGSAARNIIYIPGRVFYPAPGNRGYGEGALWDVGVNGFSWASSVPTGAGAYSLRFGYGSIYPNSNDGRAYGFQLRCLQE